jgi:hypothetical protein
LTSNITIKYTVKKPRSALETNEYPHTTATNTSYQVKSTMMELNMATVEEKKYEKSEEPDEIDETNTDKTIQHEKEEHKKKLVITRRQVCDMDKVQTAVKRPGSAFENPHTLTTYPPEESLQPSENAKPSPIILPVRSLNPTKLKLPSVQNQGDLTVTLATQHMEKVHEDDSNDSEYMVEKVPSYKLTMGARTIKNRKYEVLATAYNPGTGRPPHSHNLPTQRKIGVWRGRMRLTRLLLMTKTRG